MEKLDHAMLSQVKKGFVAMPGGADQSMGAGPVAGGGMLTQAQASPMGGTPQGGAPMDPSMAGGQPPMDPSMMGGDPSMQGGQPPMDPAMMGGAPMDPSMMGGAAPAPAPDPAAAGGGAPSVDAGGQITLSPSEFIAIIQAIGPGSAGAKPKTPKAGGGDAAGGQSQPQQAGSGVEAKLDQLIQMLGGGQIR